MFRTYKTLFCPKCRHDVEHRLGRATDGRALLQCAQCLRANRVDISYHRLLANVLRQRDRLPGP